MCVLLRDFPAWRVSWYKMSPLTVSWYESPLSIDKLYTQISNVFRLCLRIEPFSVMFWALGIVLAHILKQLTQPAGLASLNSGTGTVLYGRGQLGSIWLKTSRLPACSYLALLLIYAQGTYDDFKSLTCWAHLIKKSSFHRWLTLATKVTFVNHFYPLVPGDFFF